jgi:hypothetical protein
MSQSRAPGDPTAMPGRGRSAAVEAMERRAVGALINR